MIFEAGAHRYLVAEDFDLARAPTAPPADAPDRRELRTRLRRQTRKLAELQRRMYAEDRHSVLLVFQGLDAAGKDGTIRAVLSGLNPAGCSVWSFGPPSSLELDHDFLWRTTLRLPERGHIGVFNRSHYEEVLTVRVHRHLLARQRLPGNGKADDAFWAQRMESIVDHERHLARNGTVVLKFFLHVSRGEQRERLLRRLREPTRHWKFSMSDIDSRERWGDYQAAYQAALTGTSRPWAPWYAIPADDKPWMRQQVSSLVLDAVKALKPLYPEPDTDSSDRLRALQRLLAEG